MKEKEKFIYALETLLYSWGGDTPAEAIWTANHLIEWYEKEYNIKIKLRFSEMGYEKDEYTEDYDAVIEELRNK